KPKHTDRAKTLLHTGFHHRPKSSHSLQVCGVGRASCPVFPPVVRFSSQDCSSVISSLLKEPLFQRFYTCFQFFMLDGLLSKLDDVLCRPGPNRFALAV